MRAFHLNIENEAIDPGPILIPEPVGFSFDAPGWYGLLAFVLIFLVFLLVRWLKQYLKDAYRREALKKLSGIYDRANRSGDMLYISELLVLLKLVSISAYGRSEVAALSGKDWLFFLENKGKSTPFLQYEKEITGAIYNNVQIENQTLEKIHTLSKRWIKTHA